MLMMDYEDDVQLKLGIPRVMARRVEYQEQLLFDRSHCRLGRKRGRDVPSCATSVRQESRSVHASILAAASVTTSRLLAM
jgi:hypothetical protein